MPENKSQYYFLKPLHQPIAPPLFRRVGDGQKAL